MTHKLAFRVCKYTPPYDFSKFLNQKVTDTVSISFSPTKEALVPLEVAARILQIRAGLLTLRGCAGEGGGTGGKARNIDCMFFMS